LAKADINDVVRNINVEETNILKWNGTLFPVSNDNDIVDMCLAKRVIQRYLLLHL